MPFSVEERKQLLAVRYVGKTTIQHLEDLGINSLAELAIFDASQLAKMIAIETGIDGWETHTLALWGLEGAITTAKNDSF